MPFEDKKLGPVLGIVGSDLPAEDKKSFQKSLKDMGFSWNRNKKLPGTDQKGVWTVEASSIKKVGRSFRKMGIQMVVLDGDENGITAIRAKMAAIQKQYDALGLAIQELLLTIGAAKS